MASRLHDLVFAAVMVGIGVLAILFWIPNDIETGMVETFRRQTTMGDAFLPVLTAYAVLICAAIQLTIAIFRREDPTAITTGFDIRSPVVIGGVLLIVAVSLVLVFWTGPLAVALFGPDDLEFGYRQARDSFPWKYVGYVVGGFVMIFALTSLIEGAIRLRRAVSSILAVLFLILVFDVPFENILLPPNGDW